MIRSPAPGAVLALLFAAAVAAAASLAAQGDHAMRHGPTRDPALADLPLVERRAPTGGGKDLAVLLTGDGNWAATDRRIARAFNQRGTDLVALRMRDYLTSAPRTPAATARDVERIIRRYGAAWGRQRLVLVGYSRGADLLPFVVNRLSPDVRARVRALVLIAPAEHAGFTFHLIDLVHDQHHPGDLPTLPELMRVPPVPVVCVYGLRETDSLCREAPPGRIVGIAQPGGHHVHDQAAVFARVMDALAAAP